LIPFEVGLVTAITIALIGVIVTIYLLILKRNGWIGEASNYRCPNPQCGKIFQKPLRVKDFSTGKEIGFACPECGYDLGLSKGEKGLKETALQKELKIRDSVSILIGVGDSTVHTGTKEPKVPVATHPAFKSEKSPTKQPTVQAASQQHIVKKTTVNQAGVKEEKGGFICPACKKEFRTPLFTLENVGSTQKLRRHCPYCDQPLE